MKLPGAAALAAGGMLASMFRALNRSATSSPERAACCVMMFLSRRPLRVSVPEMNALLREIDARRTT
jgi:hypothetical protein